MKHIYALFCAALLAAVAAISGRAQAPESIWLAASTSAYQAGDTVIVTVNGESATPIQGFTFQIRYDPACLKPTNAASPISAMNGLSLPETAGLVDASFASTTPQSVNGVLAEVHFLSLSSCQTDLVLVSAALAIRNQSGFAAPVSGITLGNKSLALNIAPGAGGPKATPPVVGTPLPLGVELTPTPNRFLWGLVTILVVLFLGIVVSALVRWSRKKPSAP